MFKAGDKVRWMLPLDNCYSYGRIESIKRSVALVTQIGGYYNGKQIEVHLRYIEKARKGGLASGSKNSKIKRR